MTKEKSRSFWRAGGFSMGGSDTNITTSILPSIETTTTPQNAELIVAPDLFYKPNDQLTEVQLTARVLHDSGLNVLPIPRPEEVSAHPGKDPKSKPAYLLEPFFTQRLHKCDGRCKCDTPTRKGGFRLPIEARFDNLFYYANIGVMVGATSGNLVDIDCDTQEAYRHISDQFEWRNIHPWQYTSSRGGHYLVRVREGEVVNIKRNAGGINGVEVYGNKHYAVLPPSTHRSGEIYIWASSDPLLLSPGELPPEVSINELDFLDVKLRKTNQGKGIDLFGLPPFTAYLSTNNRRILADGIAGNLIEGERNNKLVSAALDLAANIQEELITYAEGEGVLLEAAEGCGFCKGDGNARSMLEGAMKKANLTRAKDYESTSYKDENTQKQVWHKAARFAMLFDWRLFGRVAQGARAVFLACVERSKIEGEVFRASVREVQELANFGSEKRAHRLQRRLLKSTDTTPALLHLVERDIINGYQYAFTQAVLQSAAQLTNTTYTAITPNDHSITTPVVNVVIRSDFNNNNTAYLRAKKDLFYTLGKVSERVYDHLLFTQEPSIAAIARNTNQRPASVGKAVKQLIDKTLIKRNKDNGYYFSDPKTIDTLDRLTPQEALYTQVKRKYAHLVEREKRVNRLVSNTRREWRKRISEATINKTISQERA